MIILTNMESLQAQNNITNYNAKLQQVMQKLSSGLKINSAADDAAGLSVATRLASQVNGNTMAEKNIQSGISLAQTADGALSGIQDQLERMRTLLLQAQNGTNSVQDKTNLQNEVDNIQTNINQVANQTNYNGINLLNNAQTIFDTSETRTIGPGGSSTFTYNIPPKDPSIGSIFTLTTDKTLTGETWNKTQTLNATNLQQTSNWTAPAGYTIKSATVTVNTSGDLHDPNETVDLYVNGSHLGYNNDAAGNTHTYNISGIVSGGNSINMEAIKSDQVGTATANWTLNVTYERIENASASVNSTFAGQSSSQSSTFTAPAGYTIVGGTANVVTSGDLSGGDETSTVSINGSNLGTQDNVDGNNQTYNISSLIAGQKSFSYQTSKTPNVGSMNANWNFTLTLKKDSDGSTGTYTYNGYNQSLANATPNSNTQTINTPFGGSIVSATMTTSTSGDMNEPNEYANIYANGNYVTQENNASGTNTYNITGDVAGSNQIQLQANRSSDVGNANVNTTVNYTYEHDISSNTTSSQNLNNTSNSGDTIFTVPDGYSVAKATLQAITSGDLNRPDETVALYANGNYLGTQGGTNGNNNTYDITNAVEGSSTIDLRGVKSATVGSANVQYVLTLNYMPTTDTMTADAPNGDTFGTGETYLNNSLSDTSNTSTVGAYYSKSQEQEQMTFYNPDQGNWNINIQDPSSTYQYTVGMEAKYEEATTINIHSGYQDNNEFDMMLSKVTTDTLGITGVNVNDPTAINRVDTAIDVITGERAKYGRYINVLNEKSATLAENTNDLAQAKSRIQDADMAQEMSELVKAKIQTSYSMNILQQANANKQNVLKILNG